MSLTHSHIPEHLWQNILLLLPVKSLLLSRCVCKSWNQVISHDSFIKFHLAHNKASFNTNKYLLLWNEDRNSQLDHNVPYSTSLVNSETYSNVLESHLHHMHDIFRTDSANYVLEVYGICDGLLCLSAQKYKLKADSPIYLWNPIVRKGKKLPPIEIEKDRRVKNFYLCFGYHDDDYKVIDIVPYLPTSYHVHIYSLSMDCWKKLQFDNNTDLATFGPVFKTWSFNYPKTRLVNGSAYFVQNLNGGTGQVVFFDLGREILQQINLPDDFHFHHLEEHEKTIAVLGYSDGGVGNPLGLDLEMWVLTVADQSFSWDKKFSIKAERKRRFCPMGFISDNKLVVKRFVQPKPYLNEYFLYDVGSELRVKFTLPVRLSERVEQQLYFFINGLTESLVLLNGTTTPCTKMQPGSSNATIDHKESRRRKRSQAAFFI